jgi:hypothetical protein
MQSMTFCARALAADVTHAETRALLDEIERKTSQQRQRES